MRTKFILGLIGRVTPLTVAFIIAVVVPNNFTKGCWYVAAITILVLSEYVGIYRPLVSREELRKKQMDCFIKPFVSTATYGRKKVKLRVNVVLIRRYWFSMHLFQFYQHGMSGFPDANLHFSVHKGLCGRALMEHTQKVSYIDLRKTPWDGEFTDKEVQQTKHIKAIATIPLLRETKTFMGRPTTEYFGCLNIDSTDDLGADFLSAKAAQEQILALAELVQTTFS